MGVAVKFGLLLVFAATAALVVFLILLFRRPLAMTVWLRRNALRRAGLRKTKLTTSAGEQIVWHGGAGPLLVLLHGAGDQAGTWNKVAPELRRHFQLVIPDLAGHGESDPREGALSLGTLLTALEQVFDANPWRDAPMALVGNSLGAWMAMLYAQKHARRVTRVILIDGGPIKSVTEIGIMPKDREEARRTLDAALDRSSPRLPNFVLDDLVRVSNSGPISRLMAAGVEDMSKYLLEDQLAGFQLPVDLIWGASDRLVPLDYAKKLQSRLPHCTLTVIERCGHAPQLERPRELTRVLLQILTPEAPREPASEQSVSEQSGKNP
ncbi:MAG TPA: alpha/beta fold hydrolase [Candidatus Acidoferrum sp.]|nr:alpha/beta fold hydrolase [Candidatus Acidoferrum sp.]